MRTAIASLFMVLSLAAHAGEPVDNNPEPEAEAASMACPKSPSEWQPLLEKVRASTMFLLEAGTAAQRFEQDRIARYFLVKRCFAERPDDPYLKACVSPIVALIDGLITNGTTFTSRKQNPKDYEYGWGITDQEYFNAVDALTQPPPEFIKPEFIDLLNQRDIAGLESHLRTLSLDRVKEGKPPLLFATYQVEAAPGGVKEIRTTIMYPGDASNNFTDRWIAIHPMDKTSNLFSVIGAKANPDGYVAYRDSERKDVMIDSSHKANFPGTSCKKCHQSGLIVPHVQGKAKTWGSWLRFLMLTTKAEGYGILKHYGAPHVMIDVPSLGKDTAGLSECVKKEHKEINEESLAVILENANCAQCHNGKKRQKLLPPFGGAIVDFIRKGVMPHGNVMSVAERAALADCLVKSYFAHPDSPFFSGKGPVWNHIGKLACFEKPTPPTPPKGSPVRGEH